MRDPVTDYAMRVLDGDLVAGPHVIHACERHMMDLQRDDIYLDLQEVSAHLQFFAMLKHWKGRWAGQPIVLEPWQEFIQGSVFGWKRRDSGLRRYHESMVQVPRKNGKSTIGAGTGLYGMALDGEPGAEVYAVATKRDQSKIVWNDAKQMVLKCAALRKRINSFVSNLSMPSTGSKFEPLGRDSKSLDGLNVHMAIVDELHAWQDRLLWSQVEDATGARENPLVFVITTSGVDPNSFCFEKIEHSINVLNPEIDYEDDTLFAYIATVDDPEQIDDPVRWAMANPNLGVSKSAEYMAEQYRKACQLPSRMTDFKVKHLDIWCNAAESWLDLARWKAAEDDSLRLEDFAGVKCYSGLDLAETNDLSAKADLFIPGDGIWYAYFTFWCPENDILTRSKFDKVPYDQWVRDGHLVATPGDATDYDFIEAAVRESVERLDVAELVYDRYKSQSVVQNLERDEVVTTVPYGQGYVSASPALKEIERRLLNGTLKVIPNPVMSWCASNAEVARDPSGNIKLNKRDPRKRIDGVAALMNAVGGALINKETEGPSVYEERGILTL